MSDVFGNVFQYTTNASVFGNVFAWTTTTVVVTPLREVAMHVYLPIQYFDIAEISRAVDFYYLSDVVGGVQ